MDAILFVARSLLATDDFTSGDAGGMFCLGHGGATDTPHQTFQLHDVGLQFIIPLSTAAMERALVHGLFGSVLLHFLAVPGCADEAYAVAAILGGTCNDAASRFKAAREAHDSVGQSAIACMCPSWIAEMGDAAAAVTVLFTGDITTGDMGALHRVQHATTGSLMLLSLSIKEEPWATKARLLYDRSELTIMPLIAEALRTCPLHPAAWALAATSVQGWKEKTRPGHTQPLERTLWDVLMKGWATLNTDDEAACCSFLAALRLARGVTGPYRPDDAGLDTMQVVVPTPQFILSSLAP